MATTLWRLCGRSLVAYLRCRGRTISTVTALTEVERRGEVQDVPAKDSASSNIVFCACLVSNSDLITESSWIIIWAP
jgi:hypothetical protein